MKNKVTITAVMTNPEGKEIFRSEHTTDGAATDAASRYHFTAIIHPMKLILTDAQKQFLPAAKAGQDPTAPGDDAIVS